MKRFLIFALLCGAVFVMAGCGTGNNSDFAAQTGQNNATLAAARAPESITLKDGGHFKLTAEQVTKTINGKTVRMFGYNGEIPGPTIVVPQNATITIDFQNHLDIATTLHPHGVRVKNAFDGVPGVTQKEIPPGGTFSYTINFPDPGIYFYHPHFREDYEQEMGLAGVFLVKPADPHYFQPVNREIPLVLDDILLDEKGLVPFHENFSTHALTGRFGNTYLVNGAATTDTPYTLDAADHEVVRFYLVNVANTRVFNFSIPGARIKLVGGDHGAYENEKFNDHILIGPGERAIIDVLFPKTGVYSILHTTPRKSYSLGIIQVGRQKIKQSYMPQFLQKRIHKDVIKNIDPYRAIFDSNPTKTITLTVDTNTTAGGNLVMPGMNDAAFDSIEWEDDMSDQNAFSTSQMISWKIRDEATGKINDKIDWKLARGKPIKIRIVNEANSLHPMQHPIHFHGQRFLIVSRNNATNENLVWKDTVLVGRGETVDIILDPSNPGVWAAHCNIPEHMESGMMFMFTVK